MVEVLVRVKPEPVEDAVTNPTFSTLLHGALEFDVRNPKHYVVSLLHKARRRQQGIVGLGLDLAKKVVVACESQRIAFGYSPTPEEVGQDLLELAVGIAQTAASKGRRSQEIREQLALDLVLRIRSEVLRHMGFPLNGRSDRDQMRRAFMMRLGVEDRVLQKRHI